MKTSSIAILLLAAGNSSRMGGIKQLLPWKGTSLINCVLQEAMLSEASRLFLVLGAYAGTIRKALVLPENAEVVVNDAWQQGMGSTISTGIREVLKKGEPPDGVLLMLCDQPLITSEYLSRMITTFQKGRKGIVASGYGPHAGVPALFAKRYFPALARLDSDVGAREILARNQADCQLLEAGEMLQDMDTMETYKRLYPSFGQL